MKGMVPRLSISIKTEQHAVIVSLKINQYSSLYIP